MNQIFSQIASAVSTIAGRPYSFILCVLIIVVWGVSGPIFKFSDTWQLIINTGTTIVTFLMVFLIQNTQNRETSAMQVKLDEIILSLKGAQNRMIGIEHLTDKELERLVEEAEDRAEIPPEQRNPRTGRRLKKQAAAKGSKRAPRTARPTGAKGSARAASRSKPK